MPVVVRRRGGVLAPVLVGAMVGSAAARSSNARRQQAAATQNQLDRAQEDATEARIAAAQAQGAADAANAALRQQQLQQQQLQQAGYPPQGYPPQHPGYPAYPQQPPGMYPPQPAPVAYQQPVHAVAYAQPAVTSQPPQQVAVQGRAMLQQAFSTGSVPQAISLDAVTLEVISAHIVDESSAAMKAHNILSVPKGAMVTLVRGDLQRGLGAPYADYVEIQYNGKVGKISRLVVKIAAHAGAPPPAIGL